LLLIGRDAIAPATVRVESMQKSRSRIFSAMSAKVRSGMCPSLSGFHALNELVAAWFNRAARGRDQARFRAADSASADPEGSHQQERGEDCGPFREADEERVGELRYGEYERDQYEYAAWVVKDWDRCLGGCHGLPPGCGRIVSTIGRWRRSIVGQSADL
jgi:hypothetical protein